MIAKFDASHRCVLKEWETITEMVQCREDVEKHLKEFAQRVCRKVYNNHASLFEQDDRLENDWEFVVEPRRLVNWKKSDCSLLSLGVEHISVDQLRHLGSDEPCWFYVYSPYRDDKPNDTSTDQLLSMPPPHGFEPRPDSPYRGYVFRNKLPALTPDDICNTAKLDRYFTDPLVTLIEWYKANENALLKAFGGSRRKKSRK